MSLAKAITKLMDEYEKACKSDHVRNPLAYALYKVWKMVDAEDPR